MYRGRHFIREQIFICGDYMDASVYPVFQALGKRRSKCKPTSEIQAKLNQRNAEKKVTRLIHNNFCGEDIAVHLTYEIEPEDIEQAKKDLTNYLRRIKRARKKLGLSELKYIATTEYGARSGRVHHHVIMTGGMDRDMVETLWGKGYANTKRLQFKEDGVTGLAHYIVKDRNFYRRWNGSKNLVQPEPIIRDGNLNADEVKELEEAIEDGRAWEVLERLYPDYKLSDANVMRNNINQGTYISYEMKRVCLWGDKSKTRYVPERQER